MCNYAAQQHWSVAQGSRPASAISDTVCEIDEDSTEEMSVEGSCFRIIGVTSQIPNIQHFRSGGSHGRSAGEPPFTMRKEGLGLAR